jgi:hypothetical protein
VSTKGESVDVDIEVSDVVWSDEVNVDEGNVVVKESDDSED